MALAFYAFILYILCGLLIPCPCGHLPWRARSRDHEGVAPEVANRCDANVITLQKADAAQVDTTVGVPVLERDGSHFP